MKKLLTLFSALSVFPTLDQLTISCESSDKNELSKILNSIKPLNITEINENELKKWCLNWIKYIEKEKQPSKLDNAKLKDIILINLAIYAVAHCIDEETEVKAVIKQLSTDNNASFNAVILKLVYSALQKISEKK